MAKTPTGCLLTPAILSENDVRACRGSGSFLPGFSPLVNAIRPMRSDLVSVQFEKLEEEHVFDMDVCRRLMGE